MTSTHSDPRRAAPALTTPYGAAMWIRSQHPDLDDLITDLEYTADCADDYTTTSWVNLVADIMAAVDSDEYRIKLTYSVAKVLDLTDEQQCMLRSIAAFSDLCTDRISNDISELPHDMTADWCAALCSLINHHYPHTTTTQVSS